MTAYSKLNLSPIDDSVVCPAGVLITDFRNFAFENILPLSATHLNLMHSVNMTCRAQIFIFEVLMKISTINFTKEGLINFG